MVRVDPSLGLLECNPTRERQAGYVFVTLALMSFVLVASIGLAVDYGTAFVVRNETQTFVDSAVLAATLELDGTADGIERARQRATGMPNQWLFSSTAFEGVLVEFASDPQGPWEIAPGNPVGVRFARVTANANAPMAFLPIVTNEPIASVRAVAAAGQVEKRTFQNGVFPFSPFAHDPKDPHFGFAKGTKYTLRWPNNMNKHAQPCEGDAGVQHVLDMKEAAGPNVQGYIDTNSAAAIRSAILNSEHNNGRTHTIGEPIFMSNGNKQSMEFAMQDRVNQDLDKTSRTYAQYSAPGNVNSGRRLVVVPVNEGPATNFRNAGFALFFLDIASTYSISPSESFCAEYVGSAVLGAPHQGASPTAGAFAVRLIQ